MRLCLAVLLLVAGCEKTTQPQNPPEKLHLVSPQEIQAIEKRLLSEVAANRDKKCPRPVLRGEPLEGSAEADILALVEGTPALNKCEQLLDAHNDLLHDNLLYPEDQSPPGVPPRSNLTAREVTKPGPELAGLDAACLPLTGLIHKAVRHREACSPYRPGLRGEPKLIRVIRTVRYAAYRARTLAGGRPAEAFDLLLDSLRFCQDFSRGGTSVLETMVAVGAVRSVLPVIELILNHPTPLSDPLLARVERELGVLIGSQPHPASFLRGEIQSMSLYTFMPGIKGQDWTPPGGWGDTGGPPGPRFSAAESGLDEAEGNALAQMAMQETGQAWQQGCREGDLPIHCYQHMEKLGKDLQESAKDFGSIEGVLKYAVAKNKVKETRRQIIEILKSIASPAFEKYIAKEGQVRFTLAALRLQAAYRRLAGQTRSCPEAAVFDRPPLNAWRSDPYSGGTIRVESLAPGKLVLRPPVPVGQQAGDDQEPAVFIDCPYQGRP